MKHVSFEEYEAAKAEIIGGVQYKEKSELEGDVIRKTYSTEENGTFYEVNDGGRVEFGATSTRIAGFTMKTSGPGFLKTGATFPDMGNCWPKKSERKQISRTCNRSRNSCWTTAICTTRAKH